MKLNLPVTDQEYELSPQDWIVTKTDLKGIVTYASPDFVRISGYSAEELLGASHNIVRHPDMPVEAFADLWQHIQAQRPWTGLVKNRRKDGGFYWVEANVAPIVESGRLTGYVSVRTRPEREAVVAAERAYRLFREGQAKGLAIVAGQVVRVGLGSRLGALLRLGAGGRVAVFTALLVLALLAVGGYGLLALRSDAPVAAAPAAVVADVATAARLVQRNRLLLEEVLPGAGGEAVGRAGAEVEAGLARIASLLPVTAMTSAEARSLHEAFVDAHTRLVEDGLRPLLAALRGGSGAEARRLLPRLRELEGAAGRAVAALEQQVREDGQRHLAQAAAHAQAQREQQRNGLIALLAGTVVLALLLGLALRRSLRGPLAEASRTLGEIAAGNFNNRIDSRQADELGLFLEKLRSMQTRLGFDLAESRRVGEENLRIRIGLDNVSTGVMIADNANHIVYVNPAVQRMLKVVEGAMRERAPGFSAEALVGASIDQFHQEPGHQRRLLAELTETYRSRVDIGGRTFRLAASPVFSTRRERLGTVVEWVDVTEELAAQQRERALAQENLRIRIALDNVSTGVMIADPSRTIIYTNRAVQQLLSRAESDLRKQLPEFSAARLLGSNMDQFHRNPAHQAQLLATFTSSYAAEMNIGGRTMRVVANPVINERGERLGAVAEWTDRTAEVAVEKEIESLVAAAARGDFSKRLALEDKEGFFRKLGESLNALLDTTATGLDDIARVVGALAEGDLTATITGDYSGLFGELRDSTNVTVQRLREIVDHIKEATDAINTASKEIAAGNTDLSSRTEEQASSLEETASSMEQLTGTVKQNADNAGQVKRLAAGAQKVAEQGGEVVHQMVDTMGAIHRSSSKIADIIGVIDGIAFQTNILALNAAVEAARAGEQGRGFAVVASEVRNLAQRSAAAAKEIKALISDSVEKVESGSRLAESAGNTMEEVVASIKRVAEIMASIADASREQSAGIEQVGMAISQMDEVTQQNAALVEEAAAAAESLEDQARTLVEAVSIFRLEDGPRSWPVPSFPPISGVRPAPVPHRQGAIPRMRRPVEFESRQLPASLDDDWQEF